MSVQKSHAKTVGVLFIIAISLYIIGALISPVDKWIITDWLETSGVDDANFIQLLIFIGFMIVGTLILIIIGYKWKSRLITMFLGEKRDI